MGPSSAIQVLEQSPERLLLYEPPYMPFAVGFLALGVFIIVLFFLFMWGVGVRGPMRFSGCLLALPFLFFGLKALTSHGTVEFSAATSTVTIRHTEFFQSTTPRVIPLNNVVQGIEMRARRSYAVGLLLRSGERVTVTAYGDQAGKPGMLDAINRFLMAAR